MKHYPYPREEQCDGLIIHWAAFEQPIYNELHNGDPTSNSRETAHHDTSAARVSYDGARDALGTGVVWG